MKKILMLILCSLATCVCAVQRVAFVRNSDDAILRRVDYSDSWSATDIAHKYSSTNEVRVIPIVVDPDPIFDPATQDFDQSTVVESDHVRVVKTVRDLHSGELKDVQRNARITQIESTLGPIVTKLTNGQNLTQLELHSVLSYLLAVQGINE